MSFKKELEEIANSRKHMHFAGNVEVKLDNLYFPNKGTDMDCILYNKFYNLVNNINGDTELVLYGTNKNMYQTFKREEEDD